MEKAIQFVNNQNCKMTSSFFQLIFSGILGSSPGG